MEITNNAPRSGHPTTVIEYAGRIRQAIATIEDDLDRTFSLAEVARAANFSPFHFHRIFSAIVGETPAAYVRRLRLERAARWLIHRDDDLTTIALRSGFGSQEAFTRAFKARFDLTPGRFRAQMRGPTPGQGLETGQLEARIEALGGGDLGVRIEPFAGAQVVALRHVGPYQQVGQAWEALSAWCGPRGLLVDGIRSFGIAHDDPSLTDDEQIRYDACFTCPVEAEGDRQVQRICIPAGSCAVAEFQGPWNQIPELYDRVYGGWLPHSGVLLADRPSFTEHLDPLVEVPQPQRRTRLYVPLDPST